MPKAKPIPRCPDPLRYILIEGKEGPHWRLKRGLGKPAELNETFKENAQNTGATEAKRISNILEPYTKGLTLGRKIARLSGQMRTARKKTGEYNFSSLKGFDFQKAYPMENLLHGQYKTEIKNGMLIIRIPLNEHTIHQTVNYFTHYYFEAILIYGDPAKENSLRTESELSPLYPIINSPRRIEEIEKEQREKPTSVLTLQLPEDKPWMFILKVGTQEHGKEGHYGKMFGMKVIETSFDL